MVDRKLIGALLTIAFVVISELAWPSARASVAVHGPHSADTAPYDASALLREHRRTVQPPTEGDMPSSFGPMQLPFSMVSLLSDGTNWEVRGAGADVDAWAPLTRSTVVVNAAEGYVMATFMEDAPAPTMEDDDAHAMPNAALTAVAHRGLQTLACEEHGGAGVSASWSSSPAGTLGQARRRVRTASSAKITGRCFLTLDDPTDVMSEEETVAFTYEVVPTSSETAGRRTGVKRTGAAAAGAARRAKSAAATDAQDKDVASAKASTLSGASGWLELQQEVDVETPAHDEATPRTAGHVAIGAINVRQGVIQSTDGGHGFKATIQLYFFPTRDDPRGLARLFPAAVEMTGVHGSFARAAQEKQDMARKASVTGAWARYVVPALLALGVYVVTRVLNDVLTRWLDRQQKKKEAAGAAAGGDKAAAASGAKAPARVSPA